MGIFGRLIGARTGVQVRPVVDPRPAIPQGIALPLQGGEAVEFMTELVKIGTLGRLSITIQHAMIFLDDGMSGTATRATKQRLISDARVPTRPIPRGLVNWCPGDAHYQSAEGRSAPTRHHRLQTSRIRLGVDLVQLFLRGKTRRVQDGATRFENPGWLTNSLDPLRPTPSFLSASTAHTSWAVCPRLAEALRRGVGGCGR